MKDIIPFEPKSIEFEIDGVKYTKKELIVDERNILLFKVLQLVGSSGEGLGNMDDDIDFGKMIMGVLFKYTPEQAAAFIKDTIMAGLEFPNFKHGLNDPSQPDYDRHFTQYYTHQIQVLQEIWEQNFGASIELIKKKFMSSMIFTKMFSLLRREETQTPQNQDLADPKQ